MKIAQQYFNRGNSKIVLKDYAAAIICFDKGIELNPKFAKAYYQRGLAKNFHNYQDSAPDFSKELEIDPEDSAIIPQKGVSIVYTFKNRTDAIADFDKAIAINPGYAKAFYHRGVAKSYYHDFAGALNDFIKAVEIDPTYTLAYIKLKLFKKSLAKRKRANRSLK